MKIYSPPDNHILAKILFTARISNTPLQHQIIPYGHKNKQFHDYHTLFTSPALETSPNNYVFGTHSILRYLAPKSSLDAFQQAEINQWLELIEKDLQPAVGVLILKYNQLTEVKEDQINKAKQSVIRVAKILDDRLKLNTFLVGTSLTIADISSFYSWNQVNQNLQKESKNLTNLHRWVKHISSIPSK